MSYSTQKVSAKLISEIKNALGAISWGSIEIYVQDKKVTQITVRNIKKTSLEIDSQDDKNSQRKKTERNHVEVLTISE